MSLLAETALLLGDLDAAGRLHASLEPWAGCAVSDPGEGFRGAVARDLGAWQRALGTTTRRRRTSRPRST